jgi:predicted GIY-YIG superfamily endonuclease
MLTFYVYILKCNDSSYYTGHTDDLETRLAEHKLGTVPCYTLTRRPVELVYCQEFGTREEAFTAERQIKGWSRRKKEALIKDDWKQISALGKKLFT